MGNMSYCRFQNTLADLRDCEQNMDEANSVEEQRARYALIKLCYRIAADVCSDDGAPYYPNPQRVA